MNTTKTNEQVSTPKPIPKPKPKDILKRESGDYKLIRQSRNRKMGIDDYLCDGYDTDTGEPYWF